MKGNLTSIQPIIKNAPSAAFKSYLLLPITKSRQAEGGLRTRRQFKQPTKNHPLVSIVTVVRNGESFIQKTIDSVAEQTYPNIEHIIIDGASTDGTLDIIEKNDSNIDYWVSEKDHGISDAFNKGIALCLGDIIGIINSDDWYAKTAVELSVKALDQTGGFSFGGCTYINADNTETKRLADRNYSRKIPYFMPQIHHPTVFVKKSIYQTHGTFDPELKYSMDYDLLLRLHKAGVQGNRIDSNIAFFRNTGITNKSYREVRREVRKISIHHGTSRITATAWYCTFMLKHYILSPL
ncbi:MAG: glycosyltransferase [Kiritimatiellae bacterium]|nr:glycosyltransferase [Kiritimatiellia bacterium]